jgi:predicted PurR-regulated permease PerM
MNQTKSSPIKPHDPQRPQVSVKTVMTVGLVAIFLWVLVSFVGHTVLALTLTIAALMVAVALDHGVALLERRGIPRLWAIAIVLVLAAGVIAALGFVVIPPAASQGKALLMRLPEIFKSARSTRVFQGLDDRLHIASRLLSFERELPRMIESTAAPILSLLGGVLSAVAAVATVVVLAVFMLIFGGDLVRGLLGETLPERRPLYASVIEKTYRSIGGYLMGLGLICSINATLTTTFLAIVGIPFFLPMGIVSGLSSLVPYAGPAVVGTTVTLIALATGGLGKGIACAIYFLAYGQLEGQVLAPMVFRRTVHVNPLVVVLSILFFAELAGIFGAVIAVPAAAAIQIVLREILRIRRERLHLAATPLNSPEEAEAPEPQRETAK